MRLVFGVRKLTLTSMWVLVIVLYDVCSFASAPVTACPVQAKVLSYL